MHLLKRFISFEVHEYQDILDLSSKRLQISCFGREFRPAFDNL
jgi:hypothetical protein